jgi:hypothetical protein
MHAFLSTGAVPMSLGLRVWSFLPLAVVLCGGCGRTASTDDPGPAPPHGGRLVFFPDGSGLVEVVKKEGAEPTTAEVSFYFYRDGFNPFDPAPESGTLVIDEKENVPLESDGEGLRTPAGPILFGNREVDGVLKVELDGEAITIPLGIR